MTIDRPGDRHMSADAMSARLAENWWAIALRGLVAILFGIIALVMPGVTILALTLLFAVYMLADGVLAIIAAIWAARHHERWGWLVLEGIADLIAGAIALLWPIITVLVFIYLMAFWAIVSGGLLVAAAFRLHPLHGRWLMIIGGVVSAIWGILLLIWPLTGALVLTWWMAGYALFFGGALIALGFRLRARRQVPPVSAPLQHA
ncbi:MAG TPA: HdeD family acid-resistance protein [Stellaceae bacterium]|jgi:uncharacterized membrane protein HdeD (DUF308 family)|nr:HdeD family acid-resistance protein [Stellaceae bacterium]